MGQRFATSGATDNLRTAMVGELTITSAHALLAGSVRTTHHDPFDRLIAAQRSEVMESFIDLPLPADTTEVGPQISIGSNRVVVRYDHVSDVGDVVWSEIEFVDVLDVEFRSSPCCAADDILAPSVVRRRTVSARLEEMLARWTVAVGWQQWQLEQGGAARYHHFTIYFDDAGCFDAIAAECRVSSPRTR